MGKHEELVKHQWERYLKRPDIVGGNFYFHDNGECVGRIKKIRTDGPWLKLEFEWSARKGKFGWIRRKGNTHELYHYRIHDHPADAKVLYSGKNHIELKGATTTEEKDLTGRLQTTKTEPEDQLTFL